MICHWASSTQQPPVAPQPDVTRPRHDSGGSATAAMPEPVPQEVRTQIEGLIHGTPEAGWYEPLDSNYRVRTGAEAYKFFQVGKVFAMLHTQAAGPDVPFSDSVTFVKYGEQAYSQIRRFVVVDVRRGFVYACAITTYSRRGTLKPGCVPKEHSIVYLDGEQPISLPNERLEKQPIQINRADPSIRFDPTSRIHYAKAYPIEMNVKVKDIGNVASEDLTNLLNYYKQENHLL